MKNQISRICSLILVLLFVMILIGCGDGFRSDINENADDDISEAIYNAVGREKVYYHGKKTKSSSKITGYTYTVHDYEDENLLTNIVEAANTAIKAKDISPKIYLEIWEETTEGSEPVVRLCNYYVAEDEYEQYKFLQCLYILGTERSNKGDASPYNKASIYIGLPEIKRLFVTDKIAQNAETEGIDWYEVWTNLEHYEVFER